jgi:hypothetical protein
MSETAPMSETPGASGALFHRDGELFVPHFYAQGPWDPDAQFGGSPAALLATLVEQTPTLTPMQMARFTLDLLRPVPMVPLSAHVRVIREGKRIQVVAASLLSDGIEVARSTALRIRKIDLAGALGARAKGLPDGISPNPLPQEPKTGYKNAVVKERHGSRQAVEYRFEDVGGGYFIDPTWVRLLVAVIEGEPVSPIARLAHAADGASGIGQPPGVPLVGINADLALNVVRYPEGDWMCMEGRGWINEAGVGQVQATISDTSGIAAAISLARLVDPATSG